MLSPMAMDIRNQVLQATDLVALIGQSVALKRRGRSYVGLCPFHSEKTPSFHVNPAKQYFMCFGCKASGTAFDFIMKRDRVDFRQALEILARQAGIEIPHFSGDKTKPGERQLLMDVMRDAAKFFENLLSTSQGVGARDYLAKRGFTPQTLKRFNVGFVPPGWDNLAKSEIARKYGIGNLATAGLVKSKENATSFYDVFRNRIIFPIRNESGQIIAFGGRVMPGSDDPAKYLNSPETPLFSKSRSIYGIDLGRQKIVESRTVSVVEGYTDVMMAHQYGASNVVSILGTAMTEQHVGILRRFADRIVLLFDGDNAGDLAVERVVQLFLTQPVDIGVATLPPGMDPDEFFLKNGTPAFDELIANGVDALTYAWKQMFKKLSASENDLMARETATRHYLELLSNGSAGGPVDAIRWGSALSRVARLTGIPLEDLHRRFKPKSSAPQSKGTAVESAPFAAPAESASALTMALRQILGTILVDSSQWHEVQKKLSPEDFPNGTLRNLATAVWRQQEDEGELEFSNFLTDLGDPDLVGLAIELTETVEQLPELNKMLEGAMVYIAQERQRMEQRQLRQQAGEMGSADEAAQLELLKKAMEKAKTPDVRRVGY